MVSAWNISQVSLIGLIWFCLGLMVPVSAMDPIQNRVMVPEKNAVKIWVQFKDKGPRSNSLSPSSRTYEDLPILEAYVDGLEAQGFVCLTRLKWQNRVSGRIDPSLIPSLRQIPSVANVSIMPRKAKPEPALPGFNLPWPILGLAKSSADSIDYGAGRSLMDSLRVNKVHAWMADAGIKPGQGMRIAIIDADFHLGSPFFKDLLTQNRIKDQYDFVSKKPIAITRKLIRSSHGAQCLSLIGGSLPGTLVGVAPNADFLLYRSEDNDHETFVEEDYVAEGIERAVDSGAQVISISLGYRYEYDDGSPDLDFSTMDGKTRPSSIAALGAARRNVLVSVSVGNLPASSHIPVTPSISAPADADSILAVGIADRLRNKCSYSCTGPSADGRVKPDIASLGLYGSCSVALANTGNDSGLVDRSGGTSFAAPVVAGIAALLRQMHPQLSAEAIRQALIKTADRYAKPDSGLGYGIVDAWAAFKRLQGDSLRQSASESWIRLYHPGGSLPLFLRWSSPKPMPNFQLLDINGRRIAVTVSLSRSVLQIEPIHDLRSGIYLARVR
jgi:serine protease AprX